MNRIESRDADAVVAALSRILAPHEMDVRHGGRAIRAQVRHVQLAACHLADLAYGAAVRVRSRVPHDRILIHTVAEGESVMALPDGKTMALSVGTMYVSMPDAPLDIAFASNSRHITANLPVVMWPASASHVQRSGPLSALDAQAAQVWLDLLRFVLGWADMGDEGQAASTSHIVGLIGNFLKERSFVDSHRPSAAAPWYIVHARRFMGELIHSGCEEIALAQVAVHVGVSVRTLQLGFRRFTGRTYGEELREQRLSELDRMLAQSSSEADVTSLMHACGIVSTGRFAGYYRDRFGMLPSARLRQCC